MTNSTTPDGSAHSHAVVPLSHDKRPWSVTLLALGVLILTVINLIRFVLSIRYWGFLAGRMGVSPIYLTLTGFVWGVAGLFVLWGLWKAKNWAPRLMQAVALTYALYFWLDHIFLMDHTVVGASGAVRVLLPSNWQFSAGVTVVSLAYIVWIFNRTKVKAYFGLIDVKIKENQVNQDA
jgi:hypothetical protein